jgi:hypothetical protein
LADPPARQPDAGSRSNARGAVSHASAALVGQRQLFAARQLASHGDRHGDRLI